MPLQAWCKPLLQCPGPTLLIIVAIVQMTLMQTSGLSAWKGGGFGMFSVPIGNRTVTLSIEGSDGSTIALRSSDIRRVLKTLQQRQQLSALVVMPSRAAAKRFLDQVLGLDLLLVHVTSVSPAESASDRALPHHRGAAGAWSRHSPSKSGRILPVPRELLSRFSGMPQFEAAAIQLDVWEYGFGGEHSTDTGLTLRRLLSIRHEYTGTGDAS